MDLTQYEKTGYIESDGSYAVTITKAETTVNNMDMEQTLVTFQSDDGRTINLRINNEAKYLWKLAKLARTCGLIDSQVMNFDPSYLIGKNLIINVIQNGKYYNVDTFQAVDQITNKPNRDDVPF